MRLSLKEKEIITSVLISEFYRQGLNDEEDTEKYEKQLLKLVDKIKNSIKAR